MAVDLKIVKNHVSRLDGDKEHFAKIAFPLWNIPSHFGHYVFKMAIAAIGLHVAKFKWMDLIRLTRR